MLTETPRRATAEAYRQSYRLLSAVIPSLSRNLCSYCGSALPSATGMRRESKAVYGFLLGKRYAAL